MKKIRYLSLNMFRIAGLILLLGIAATTVACQFVAAAEPAPPVAPPPAAAPAREQVLILGDVSGDPTETIKEFQPLADYLAANLTEYGIEQGSVVVAPDFETMINYLRNGEVDIYFDSPYPALTVYEEAGAIPLARRWKGGLGEYHTVIVASKASGITALTDLPGHILVFEDLGSTSGYLLPKAHLVNAGYTLTEQRGNGSVADDEIGYVFAESEENILAWVLSGKADIGVIQSGDFEEMSDEDKNQLVVLSETQAVPRHIALASSTVDEGLRQQIVQLMLDMSSTAEGQAVLESFEETSQFDELPAGAETMMTSLQQLFLPVR